MKKWIPLMIRQLIINQLGSQPLGAGIQPGLGSSRGNSSIPRWNLPGQRLNQWWVETISYYQLLILPVKFRLLLLKSSVVCCFYSNLAILLMLFTMYYYVCTHYTNLPIKIPSIHPTSGSSQFPGAGPHRWPPGCPGLAESDPPVGSPSSPQAPT